MRKITLRNCFGPVFVKLIRASLYFRFAEDKSGKPYSFEMWRCVEVEKDEDGLPLGIQNNVDSIMAP